MFYRLILTLFFAFLAAQPGQAETTYILVDHSATMNERLDQDEAFRDLHHYYDNLSATELVSINYFGGDNGGDCETPVSIDEPIEKANVELQRTSKSALGDNPLLAAIDSIVRETSTDQSRIIVISDFDAVCGTTLSACMSIRGYEIAYSNLNFVFEPIGEAGKNSELYKCLNAMPQPKRSLEIPTIPIELKIRPGEQTTSKDPPQTSFESNVGWAVYLILIGMILLTTAVGIRRFQFTTDVHKDNSQESESRNLISEQDRKLKKQIWILSVVTGIVALLFLLLWGFVPKADMDRILDLILNWLEGRFGSAIASTTLGGYVAWFAFSYWKGGMERMKLDWQESQKKTNIMNAIDLLESSRDAELANIQNRFDAFKGNISKEDQFDGDLRLSDLKRAFDEIATFSSEGLEQLGLKSWKPDSFNQAEKVIERLRKHYKLESSKAAEYRESLRNWREFEKSLQSKAIEFRREQDRIRQAQAESSDQDSLK